MRRYSPQYHSPPRRGYGGRGRSPPGRGHGGGGGGGGGGGYGRRREPGHVSLLVRNIPMDCRPEELRGPFERFGVVRDVYIPKDYYTGGSRGFAFVEFVDPHEASEAQYHMNGKKFAGREITVVVAAETRKRPDDMRRRAGRGPSGYGGRRSSYYGRSRSRSISRSRSPRHPSGSRGRHRSRSHSPAPRWHGDNSVSPSRRHADYSRSPRAAPRDVDKERNQQTYSADYDNADDRDENGYRKSTLESEDARAHRRSSPGRTSRDHEDARAHRRSSPARISRSPSGSRSRSADEDVSPRHGR